MSNRVILIIALAVIVILAVGCGASAPTPVARHHPAGTSSAPSDTPPTPTDTLTATYTPTLLPPTETPAARATATSLAPTPVPTASPVPSVDGEQRGGEVIAFTSARDGSFEIYLMRVDLVQSGSPDVQRLTHQSGEDYWTTWSPDGAQIAFASERDGNFELYAMDVAEDHQGADRGNLRRLTHDNGDDLEPDWSPGGGQIAFMYYSAGHSEIYVMDVDGGNRRQLTESQGDNYLPDWSPDGAQIVFVSERDGNPEIYVMNHDGMNPRRLTDNRGDDLYPAWAPDGTRISFFSEREEGRGLWVMDLEGRSLQRLTHDDARVWGSAWSPDGTKIAFTSDRDGNREIYVMDIADALQDTSGGNLRRLTNNHVLDGIPAWRPVVTATSPEAAAALGDTWNRPADGMVMAYVPAGELQMGSSDAQVDLAQTLCDEYPDEYGKCKQAPFGDEIPQHSVALEGFWLDRTEVTNAQYALCVAEGACRESRLVSDPAYNGNNYPVAGIPWQGAADYCAWAGGRLPTEAEWEYAARGSAGAIFPWGDEFNCSGGNLWDDGTGCKDGYPKPAPVGSFPQGSSWCGALDMTGNVWEWVADIYGPYPTEAQANPTGSAHGSERILRGGSWGYLPAFGRTAYRYPVPPTADYLAVGFRCAVPASVRSIGSSPTEP